MGGEPALVAFEGQPAKQLIALHGDKQPGGLRIEALNQTLRGGHDFVGLHR